MKRKYLLIGAAVFFGSFLCLGLVLNVTDPGWQQRLEAQHAAERAERQAAADKAKTDRLTAIEKAKAEKHAADTKLLASFGRVETLPAGTNGTICYGADGREQYYHYEGQFLEMATKGRTWVPTGTYCAPLGDTDTQYAITHSDSEGASVKVIGSDGKAEDAFIVVD